MHLGDCKVCTLTVAHFTRFDRIPSVIDPCHKGRMPGRRPGIVTRKTDQCAGLLICIVLTEAGYAFLCNAAGVLGRACVTTVGMAFGTVPYVLGKKNF